MQLEASRTTKAPLSLQLPEGAHFSLGGEQLRVSGFNLTLRSTGTGAHIDGEHLSRLLLVEGGAAVQLHNLHLVNGRFSYRAGGAYNVHDEEVRARALHLGHDLLLS